MSTRATRDQTKKGSFKEKKFARLLHCRDLLEEDSRQIDRWNHERQSLNFYQGICGSAVLALSMNYALFRLATLSFQTGMTLGMFAVPCLLVRRAVNKRFEARVNPLFEKYGVK